MASVSIRVVGRFRPINGKEKEEQALAGWEDDEVVPFVVRNEGKIVEVLADKKRGRPKPINFALDDVMWNCSQKEAFERIALDTVKDVMNGYNGTIFAYGQTGSGKTFSIFGPELSVEDQLAPESLDMMGIIPRCSFFLFQSLGDHPKVKNFELKVSCLEIYVGNALRDLIHPSTKNLRIRDGPKGVFVQGLQPEKINTVAELLHLIDIANRNRTVSATKMNKTSSRSHSIFTFTVTVELLEGGKKSAKLNFADLAGSEKIGKTGARGQSLKEGAAINGSLTVLGRVISALAKKTKAPFRESGLTYVLKDSLQGNTKTTLLVCLSPHMFNVNETRATLQFATRAKLIKNKIKCNKVLTKKDLQKEIKRLQKLNENLKHKLREKATTATQFEAPEEGLPYLKLTFKTQEEPQSDSQYILRRKEIQKEIKYIVHSSSLEGVYIEAEIRRKKVREEDGKKSDDDDDEDNKSEASSVSSAPSMGLAPICEEKELHEHNPLVVHLLFQPTQQFNGEDLLEAKGIFLSEISRKNNGMFSTADVEEGFANPEDYGSSLSVTMQRQILNNLNDLDIENNQLRKQLEESEEVIAELQAKQGETDVVDLESSQLIAELQLELSNKEEELVKLKRKNLSNDIKNDKNERHRASFVQINGSLSPLLSPKHSDNSIHNKYSFPEQKKRKKSPLRRTLSVRKSFQNIPTDDIFDIQEQNMSEFHDICTQLLEEEHPSAEKVIEIRNLCKHTQNQCKILYDELEIHNESHEEYIHLLKEQLETRHQQLDDAYEDLAMLKGLLAQQEHLEILQMQEYTTDEEASQSNEDENMTSIPLPISKVENHRESFVDVVNVISKKLNHLKEDFDANTRSMEPVLFKNNTLDLQAPDEEWSQDWFADEKDVIDWDVAEVIVWLCSVENGSLERFAEAFDEEKITGEALLALSHHDLKHHFHMDKEHIRMFFKDLGGKDEMVKMRLIGSQRSRARNLQKSIERKHTGRVSVTSRYVVSNAYEDHLKKLYEKDFGSATRKLQKLVPGDLVALGDGRLGRVLYQGPVENRDGSYLGLELLSGQGKHDGVIKDRRYFRTKVSRGIFTTQSKINEIMNIDDLPEFGETLRKGSDSFGDDDSCFSDAGSPASARPLNWDEDSDSFDFSLSDSDDDDETETVNFSNHNRHFSQIPTVSLRHFGPEFTN